MSFDGSGYVVGTSGGALDKEMLKTVLHKGGWIVPAWSNLAGQVDRVSGMTGVKGGLAKFGMVVASLLALAVTLIFFSYSIKEWSSKGFQGMATQTLGNPAIWGPGGAAGTSLIKLSDPNHDPKIGTSMNQAFLGAQMGPEFVEQPNYVLGNENMQRTALNQFSRLKAKGLAADWPTFWADYKANNADDLDVSMYDFGDGMADRPGAVHTSKALKKAGLGGL